MIPPRPCPWGSETPIRSRGGAVVLVDEPAEEIPPTPWGSENSGFVLGHPRWARLMWSFVYRFIRTPRRPRLRHRQAWQGRAREGPRDPRLRHQLRVLRRTSGPPKLRPIDRVLLAAASRVLPRDRSADFLVTPATLLRWHRELVRRKWDVRKDRSARPATDRSCGPCAHPPAGPGEPPLGVCPD